jgi:hypothetical protein
MLLLLRELQLQMGAQATLQPIARTARFEGDEQHQSQQLESNTPPSCRPVQPKRLKMNLEADFFRVKQTAALHRTMLREAAHGICWSLEYANHRPMAHYDVTGVRLHQLEANR